MLRRVIVLAAAFPLCGCLADQTAQVGKCEYEAQIAFPTAKLVSSPDMGQMIKACMKAHGYEYDWRLDQCRANFETEANADCYRPIR